MTSDEVNDPVSPLVVMAVQHHETFQAWQRAGFSELQALCLLQAMIMATVLKP